MRPVEFGLPADRLQPRHAGELAVQSLDDALDAPALVIGIAASKRTKILICCITVRFSPERMLRYPAPSLS
jgi:hypothetical protein